MTCNIPFEKPSVAIPQGSGLPDPEEVRQWNGDLRGTMFIDNRANRTGTDDFEWLETTRYRIYWRGLVYSSGVQAGQACMTKLAADLCSQDLRHLAPAIR